MENSADTRIRISYSDGDEINQQIEQRARWKKLGMQLVAGGFVLAVVTGITVRSSSGRGGSIAIMGLAFLASYALYITGCFNIARGKGRSMAAGLLGFLGVIGFIILMVMKEKRVEDDYDTPTVITWHDPEVDTPTTRSGEQL